MELKQAFVTPDGKIFETRKEAQDYQRRPMQKEALAKIIDNEELVDWILDNTSDMADCFQVGTIKRVSKSDRNALEKALKSIVERNDSKEKFIVENHEAILDTFRWPSVKRMEEDEKAAAIKSELTTLTENEEVADFLIANKEAIFTALEAGKVKKELNPKAAEGLAKWRAEQAAAKEAAGGDKPKKK